MRILRIQEVIKLTGLSRPTIWRKEKQGKFPERIRLGSNSVGWRSDELEEWLENLPRGTARKGSKRTQ